MKHELAITVLNGEMLECDCWICERRNEQIAEAIAALQRDDEFIGEMYKPIRLG